MEGPASPRDQLAVLSAFAPRIWRAAWVGGLVLAIGLAATAAWAVLTKRQYRSEAMLAYERGAQVTTAGNEAESGRQLAARLQELFTSRQRLESLVKRMRLYSSIVEQRNMADAVEEMRKHLAFVPRDGDTYKVTFDSESRETAQKVLDTLIKGVVDEDRGRRLREADEARKFLDAERKRADDDLKTKEAVLSEFITKHPKYASEAGGGATVGVDVRSQLQDRLNTGSALEVGQLMMQKASIEQQIVEAGSIPTGAAHGADPVALEALARAEADLRAAQLDLAAKQAHYTNEHPDVKAAARRYSDAQAAVHRAEATVRLSKEQGAQAVPAVEHVDDSPKVQALKAQLSAVNQQISVLRSHSSPSHTESAHTPGGSVATETEWTRINRDVAEAHERQTQLGERSFQAQFLATLVSGGQGGHIIVVDPPFVPLRPVAGTRSKIALVGAATAMMAALLAMVLFAAFDDRLYGSRDIERVVNEAFVVVIPRLTEKGG